MVQWLRLCLPTQGVQVQSLVAKLGIPHDLWPKSQNTEQKQCCNKFNKDFKKGPPQKKKNFKKWLLLHIKRTKVLTASSFSGTEQVKGEKGAKRRMHLLPIFLALAYCIQFPHIFH